MKQLQKSFETLYGRFRMETYKKIFSLLHERDGSLSATEMMSAEIIFYMDRPTLTQFANFVRISVPNATYKVRKLMDKGYLVKEDSLEDRRETHLVMTEKFLDYYRKDMYGDQLMSNLPSVLNNEDMETLERILGTIVEKA